MLGFFRCNGKFINILKFISIVMGWRDTWWYKLSLVISNLIGPRQWLIGRAFAWHKGGLNSNPGRDRPESLTQVATVSVQPKARQQVWMWRVLPRKPNTRSWPFHNRCEMLKNSHYSRDDKQQQQKQQQQQQQTNKQTNNRDGWSYEQVF